jgi:hypothetical protein
LLSSSLIILITTFVIFVQAFVTLLSVAIRSLSHPSIHPFIQPCYLLQPHLLCRSSFPSRITHAHKSRSGSKTYKQKPEAYAFNGSPLALCAITLVASDRVWNAIPGNNTNLADVLTRPAAPQYRARPDFDPPAALDPAATAVKLSSWKLEMDMHFAYTLPQNALSY